MAPRALATWSAAASHWTDLETSRVSRGAGPKAEKIACIPASSRAEEATLIPLGPPPEASTPLMPPPRRAWGFSLRSTYTSLPRSSGSPRTAASAPAGEGLRSRQPARPTLCSVASEALMLSHSGAVKGVSPRSSAWILGSRGVPLPAHCARAPKRPASTLHPLSPSTSSPPPDLRSSARNATRSAEACPCSWFPSRLSCLMLPCLARARSTAPMPWASPHLPKSREMSWLGAREPSPAAQLSATGCSCWPDTSMNARPLRPLARMASPSAAIAWGAAGPGARVRPSGPLGGSSLAAGISSATRAELLAMAAAMSATASGRPRATRATNVGLWRRARSKAFWAAGPHEVMSISPLAAPSAMSLIAVLEDQSPGLASEHGCSGSSGE
mmetsp:Transcript_54507/g.173160  ORF Transcript_54507/g.173160 Transcript_54507/m.173160 type:complete len:386 (-) Transcript_54507:795-1952(-)